MPLVEKELFLSNELLLNILNLDPNKTEKYSIVYHLISLFDPNWMR